MSFIIGEIYLMISSFIEGALGIMAWNMCISVAFEVPTVKFIEIFTIIFIANSMLYIGTEQKDSIATAKEKIIKIFLVCSASLRVLTLIMQIAY